MALSSIHKMNKLSTTSVMSEVAICLTKCTVKEVRDKLFMSLVLDISKGKKANSISTKGRAILLTRAKANSDTMLLEFIKVDESELLKKREEEREEKDKLMKDVIEAIGTKIVNHPEWKAEESTKKITLSYSRSSVRNDDDILGDDQMEGG